MKKLLLVAVLLPALLWSQVWRQQVTRSYPSLNAVAMVDAAIGWTVGVGGAIYKTTDGGLTWNSQTSGSTTSLGCVAAIDANTVFIGTTNRTLLKTTNGGSQWTSATVTEVTEATATVKKIEFVSSTTGYMMTSKTGDTCRVLKTTDGGATWKTSLAYKSASSTYDFLNMDFNGAVGVVAGKPHTETYSTQNGGDTWTKATTPGGLGGVTYSRSDMWAVCVASPTVAFMSGWGSSAAGLQPSIHLKSTDGGLTWTYMPQAVSNRTYQNMYSISFKNANDGITVGGSTILKTTNGGTDWTIVDFPMGATLNGSAFVGDMGIIVGNDGIILRTTDFGQGFTSISNIPASSVYALKFPSANIGYGAGFNGIFLKTTDGGRNWNGGYLGADGGTQTINDLFFLDQNTGYAAGNARLVAKTTNGGSTWSALLKDTLVTSYNCYGVWFTNATTGFVVGQRASNSDIIMRTTDGGATWDTTMNKVSKALRDVVFADATHGVAVGDAMKIVFTSNGGGSWSVAPVTGVPTSLATANLKRVAFVSGSTFFAAGGKAIVKSTDAGATWAFADSISDNSINDIVFASDGLTGYVAATKNLLKTTNGGGQWTNILDTSVTHQATIYSCALDGSNNVWLGAALGSIFTNAPLTSVNDRGNGMPDGFRLDQNYPNPFNPTTAISYQLSAISDVTLTVFDLLGREVASFMERQKPVGNHAFTFDASAISSGVYFYTLQAGTFTATKRMMLVK